MDNEALVQLYIDCFLSQKLMYFINNNLGFSLIMKEFFNLEQTKEDILQLVERLKLDKEAFKESLDEYIGNIEEIMESGEKPGEGELDKRDLFLRAVIEEQGYFEEAASSNYQSIIAKIGEIPKSIEKTRCALRAFIEVEGYEDATQVLDAITLLKHEMEPSTIEKVIQSWREERDFYQRQAEKGILPNDNIFWTSRDFMDEIDGISRYRFREYFEFGEFETTFKEIEQLATDSILECALIGECNSRAGGYSLFYISRSRHLSIRLKEIIEISLNRILKGQKEQGYWEFTTASPQEKLFYRPDVTTTALCSLAMLKLTDSESLRMAGKKGASWLLDAQNPNGSWSVEDIADDDIVKKEDLLATMFALEAINRSKTKNVQNSIENGINWLEGQQDDLGFWDERGFPFPFVTILVIELIELLRRPSLKGNPYISMARGFLQRSDRYSIEGSPNSRRLAVIAAYHGLEAFLYAALTSPGINEKIFRSKNETIGLREALKTFEAVLRQMGLIKAGNHIPLRNSLESLGHIRDEVVHKGLNVSHRDCEGLIRDAVRFTDMFSPVVFGYNILE